MQAQLVQISGLEDTECCTQGACVLVSPVWAARLGIDPAAGRCFVQLSLGGDAHQRSTPLIADPHFNAIRAGASVGGPRTCLLTVHLTDATMDATIPQLLVPAGSFLSGCIGRAVTVTPVTKPPPVLTRVLLSGSHAASAKTHFFDDALASVPPSSAPAPIDSRVLAGSASVPRRFLRGG